MLAPALPPIRPYTGSGGRPQVLSETRLTIRLATNRIAVIRRGPDMRSAAEPEDLESEDLENVVTRNDLDPLILDLLEWIARERRSYADVIEAWRTSCPRLTVWEDAVDRGFAVREPSRAAMS
jgi:hypothetical protein